jgi:hypothetical protein
MSTKFKLMGLLLSGNVGAFTAELQKLDNQKPFEPQGPMLGKAPRGETAAERRAREEAARKAEEERQKAIEEQVAALGTLAQFHKLTAADMGKAIALNKQLTAEYDRGTTSLKRRAEILGQLKVKAAEGEAQSKALQGRGIADQRQAIVAGLRDSVDEFQKSVPGTTAKDVMNLVLMTQYFDMLKEIGASSRTNAILIPHSPGHLSSLTEQLRNVMIEADQVVRVTEPRTPAAHGAGAARTGPGPGNGA